LLASEKDVRTIAEAHRVEMKHATYEFELGIEGSEGDFEKKSIEFTYCDPEQAAIVHLKTMRDQKKSRNLGIDLGGEEKEIAFVFQGDHGGDHMQILQVNAAFERITTPLGSFKEKESYLIFANTILQHIY